METMDNANQGFMQCKCGICGGTDIADTALSELDIKAGYGSQYDGQAMRLMICGKCVDRILRDLRKN